VKKELVFSTLSALLAGTLNAENLTREQLNAMLDELAKTPAPTELSPGAMCYEMAAVPERSEYSCPSCGAKTIYTYKDWTVSELVAGGLKSFHDSVATLVKLGIDAKLDERSLCETCRESLKEKNAAGDLFLDTTVDEKTTRNKIQKSDLAMLAAFLKKDDIWKDEAEEEHSVKNSMPRIRELLGIKADNPSEAVDSSDGKTNASAGETTK
jgi:hypothetical protein